MTGPSQGRRLAIAFFPGGDPGAEAAFRNLRQRRISAARLYSSTSKPEPKRSPYSHLRLPDEALIVAWIEPSELSAAVDTLQAAGARSIFLTAGGMPLSEKQECLTLTEGKLPGLPDIRRGVDELHRMVIDAGNYLVESVRLGHLPSPAGQWVIDNAYLVSLNLAELRKELPAAFKRVPAAHFAESLKMARRLVAQTGSRITEDALRDFLQETQKKQELDSAQLWSFPLVLRLALIEELAKLACRCGRVQQLREAAFLWADRLSLSSAHTDALLRQMVGRLETEPFATDRSFAVALAERLQDQESALEVAHAWMEKHLEAPLVDLVRSEHEREAADSLLASNAFGSLKVIAQIEYKRVFEAVSRAEAVLRDDPAGIYPRSDFATRDHCRQIVARIALQAGKPESDVARAALHLAQEAHHAPMNDVLFYLIAGGVETLEQAVGARVRARQKILRGLRRHSTGFYLSSIGLLTACLLGVTLALAWDANIRQVPLLVVLGALAAFPLSELAIQMVHSLLINMFPPQPLPKMDFRLGIPDDAGTLVVVPMMLSSVETVRREAEKLEVRFLANRHRNLAFALFSDFLDAPEQMTSADTPLLQEAKAAIASLNRKYEDGQFLLFHRARTWSATQQQWIGRERKRGKIEELNALLCGHGDRKLLVEGILPEGMRYVIALDADTQLPPGAALRMIETIAHPLNRVVIDPATGIRSSGFTIIQPRVSIALPGATATRFTQVFSDAHGTDPYCTVVSDAQQDLCGEAIFHGKAIYDVQAFDRILSDRFPAETLLSHDLIEGAHTGVAFASDIELLENLPLDYPSFARRQHRWIRGDWQIAAWAGRMVWRADRQHHPNPLSVLNRWRIFDNLRRSLVPVASLLLVGFGWFFSVAPSVWSIVLALTVGIPALVPVLDRWTRHIEGSVHGWQGAADDLIRAALGIMFLPHQAWLSVDAILRSFHRRYLTKRRLLEWQTADAAQSQTAAHLETTMRQMMLLSVFAGVALIVLALQGSFAPTFLYLSVWIAAPWVMRWLGGSGPAPWNTPIGDSEATYLRALARRTWRYFDDLVGEQSNWLPPDNSQLVLRVEVASRTSPTNIGLWLNAALASQDLGYISTDDFVTRCSATMMTIDKLQRYEGHLLNWYDTGSLQPLLPEYVSTVDSGNLIASLWVMAQGCRELIDSPIASTALSGLSDTVDILRSSVGADPSLAVPMQGLRQTSRSQVDGIERIGQLRLLSFHSAQLKTMKRWSPRTGDETTYWALKLAAELDSWSATIDRYLSWMELLSGPSDEIVRSIDEAAVQSRRKALRTIPSLRELANGPPKALAWLLAWRGRGELRPEVSDWLDAVNREYNVSRDNARALIARIESLANEANNLAGSINMSFLYDPARRLFGIGYAVGNPVTFSSHYDLLASECRLASLVSIAKGDVPVEHWFMLGRPRGTAPVHRALLSWSGTMFEYLMPVLFTEAFENTMLAHACAEAVDAQMAYGDRHGLPWGISEAAYSALDGNQIYQYRAFGVPNLALNPNADPGPVVSPYSSVLALMVRPEEACANLRRLEAAGLSGSMGFYESIDYTRPRHSKDDKSGVPIFAYMAHHQAMSLLALCNVLRKNVMQRRFHADLRIRAIESLLFERVPISRVEEATETSRPPIAIETIAAQDRKWTKPTLLPRVHLNSNGRYSLMVTSNGGGYSRWKGFDITRWHSDTARDDWGSFLWVKDLRSGAIWSPAPKPAGALGDSTVTFSSDRAEFSRRVNDLETKVEVAVATDDDAELRRVTISNRSLRTRRVELTSYAELVLAPHAADTAHPVFSKMFIQTELFEDGVLLAHRRSRSPEDPPIWVASMLVGVEGNVEFETDRRKFLGRGHDSSDPVALNGRLTGTTGTVLDPIFSFRHRVILEPREQRRLSFVLMAASTREDVIALVRKYQRPDAVTHAFEMIWTRAQLEFRYLRIGPAAAHRFQDLAGHLLYPNNRLRPRSVRLDQNRLGQSGLWKYGISGDLPIVMVTVADDQATGLVQEILLAHSYWRMLGLDADLVIVNREAPSYDAPLRKKLDRLLHAHGGWHTKDRVGSVYLLDWQGLPMEDQTLLLATARVVLGGHLGPLQQQLLIPAETQEEPALIETGVAVDPGPRDTAPHWTSAGVDLQNGVGAFSSDGREYVIELAGDAQTPVPWANVIANERFGTVLTESGLGFTWNGNSQMNRLTPWNNDPVSDPQSEVLYLRDEDTGVIWSPTPLPIRERTPYRIRHGQGYSIFEHHGHGIAQHLTVFAAVDQPVKICVLSLTNQTARRRRLAATYYAEWVLGSVREQQQTHIVTSVDTEIRALFARQSWSSTFAGKVAFLGSGPRASSWSGDRTAFFAHFSTPMHPDILTRMRLDNRTGAGLDPCGALQVDVDLPPGGHREVVFLLGQADSEAVAKQIIERFSDPAAALAELADVRLAWEQRLGVVQVDTPSPTANFLLNRWLVYQSLSCRIWARSAIYQSGGAVGFRDQLQDCLALIYSMPQLSRATILRAASRQFQEGDVQHWWHVESGMGVRTRCSDDLLWLPWVVAHYVDITQDYAILDERITFLEGPRLEDHEHEKMFTPETSIEDASLWEHCIRAIEHGSRFGAHGLPLMGNGDWNDGMNLVGIEGRGESVWLAWFLLTVLDQWAPLIERRDSTRAQQWRRRATDLTASVEKHAWDGEWYLRAFFDDGSPLGSSRNSEAQIDSLPQSWATLSHRAPADRADKALASARAQLLRPDDGLVLLFTPPFNVSTPHPGYIMGYPPGMRENGGQYTHAALWLAQAMARHGDGASAVEILQMINPGERTATPELLAKYRGEPYAVAADVSSSPNLAGAANWTWYTGSAGWMYRVWLEDVLGFRLRGSALTMEPVIPDEWPGFHLRYRYGTSVWNIAVDRVSAGNFCWAESDGHDLDKPVIPLKDDGAEHQVHVWIGSEADRTRAREHRSHSQQPA